MYADEYLPHRSVAARQTTTNTRRTKSLISPLLVVIFAIDRHRSDLKTNTSDDEVDSSLSSVETDVDLLLQDVIVKAANQTDDEPLEGQWKLLSQSLRGGEMAGILKSGVFDEKLKVSYNSVNEVLKDKMLVEVGQSLEQARRN
ncbi:hypothetical protein THAOC_37750 [Thalassiosira oceanica]|uniref:Uncharacterized protein n=1 Tax=Thalassiosira oceanica TaxID=159749 RepID=K0QZN5_THAOC|nr:hypothetical protein THAOC_37750 [Thalassiosira oceanica]|eukprot:EJK43774.1 hypothetical protein THAOC_37750 [Thalassiosira oceanica]